MLSKDLGPKRPKFSLTKNDHSFDLSYLQKSIPQSSLTLDFTHRFWRRTKKINALFSCGDFKKRLCFFVRCDVVRTSHLVGERMANKIVCYVHSPIFSEGKRLPYGVLGAR